MTSEKVGLFDGLTPPAGGVAALRRRLRREGRRRRARRMALGAAAVAAALATAHALTARRGLAVPAELHPALVGLGLQAPPAEPASVPPELRSRMALQRVPLETERVVLYYVAVLPESPTEPDR